MSAGDISHARDKDCVSRSNVCGGLVLFVDGFMALRDIFILHVNIIIGKIDICIITTTIT